MIFILSMIIALIFSLVFQRQIKGKSRAFYTGTAVVVSYLFCANLLGISDGWPEWFAAYVSRLFTRGSLSTAFFAIVMYLGVLSGKRPSVRRLRSIRGELSILACILALGHNVFFGIHYFPHLFSGTGQLTPPYVAAIWITVVLILIMLPLFITSFPVVRKTMKALRWKKLHKLAYPFYGLLYVHVLIVMGAALYNRLVNGLEVSDSVLTILAYSAVFIPYFVLLARKLSYSR